MNPAKAAEVSSWLTKALLDLQSAEWLLTSPDHLYHASGFHCQQTAEKALKAYLTLIDEPFEKTHSIVALVGKCLNSDPKFVELRQAATALTPFAVSFRYPGDLPDLTYEEADTLIKHAKLVWNFVLQRIPEEGHPDT